MPGQVISDRQTRTLMSIKSAHRITLLLELRELRITESGI